MPPPLRAVVRQGRLLLDVPTDLPEGTVLALVMDDEGDDLDDEEREALHAALDRALAQSARGLVVPTAEVLAELHDE